MPAIILGALAYCTISYWMIGRLPSKSIQLTSQTKHFTPGNIERGVPTKVIHVECGFGIQYFLCYDVSKWCDSPPGGYVGFQAFIQCLLTTWYTRLPWHYSAWYQLQWVSGNDIDTITCLGLKESLYCTSLSTGHMAGALVPNPQFILLFLPFVTGFLLMYSGFLQKERWGKSIKISRWLGKCISCTWGLPNAFFYIGLMQNLAL